MTPPAPPPATTPVLVGSERASLVAFLDYLRGCVVGKVSGLVDEQARQVLAPSGKSALGLVAHLTMMETAWFQWAFAGLDVPASARDQTVAPTATVAGLLAGYEAAVGRSREIVAGAVDVTATAVRTLRSSAPPEPTLRWILLHTIEDTARHVGHLDVVRELADGAGTRAWQGGELLW